MFTKTPFDDIARSFVQLGIPHDALETDYLSIHEVKAWEDALDKAENEWKTKFE